MSETEHREPTTLPKETLQIFLAGFDLVAKRTKGGKLESLLRKNSPFPYSDWPKEITMAGNIYGLEVITKGADGYESASYI